MSSPNGGTGLRLLPGGASIIGGGAGAFVRRFVNVGGVPTLAGNTRTQVNQAAVTEAVLENPSGPVQSLLPANAFPAAFLENGDGARVGNRVKIGRIGVSPVLSGIRGEGTYAAPTPPLTGVDLFLVQARPVTDTGGAGTSTVVAAIAFRSRENLGAAAWGSLIRFSAGRVGAAISDVLVDLQSGGAGVAEWAYQSATSRWIPATTGELRNPANTATRFGWNATGLGLYGAAPVAQQTIVGARGGNAALTSLLTLGALVGYWIDGTTP